MMRQNKPPRQVLYALYKARSSLKSNESLLEFWKACESEYQQLRQKGINFLDPAEDKYPPILRERLKPAPLLFYTGRLRLLKKPGIAIVGARNASNFGQECARLLAKELARRGVCVISGHARGIDRMAHLGALQSALKKGGRGGTVLILSEGILQFRPGDELRHLNNWKEKALVLSQFWPTAQWRASHAMARNKLICALAKAVIVVESGPERDEAGKMSGTFNTATTALHMGIPLFVVEYPPQAHLPVVGDIGALLAPELPEGNRLLIEKGGTPIALSFDKLEQGLHRAVKTIIQAITKEAHEGA